ncbi:MAG TPA: TonB-dependent receptor [Vicinamibacterales bacterium]|nr:TonB-dependent receptor [Vicinamibacterales bacterium]
MRFRSSVVVASAAGSLVLLCLATAVRAQSGIIQPVSRVATLATGAIQGTVQDEKGSPVAGAAVSALGATTALAYTDRSGRFELRTLPPGPYLVRAHLSGFVAPRGQIVDVRPSVRTSSSIAMRRTATPNVIAAGVGVGIESQPDTSTDAAAGTNAASTGGDDHGETAWRLRHARRSVLKDATIPADLLAADEPPASTAGSSGFFSSAADSAHAVTNLFAGTAFNGQVNLLTTGSLDSPLQMFTPENFSRSVTYLALGAPVGEHADWAVRAALTQGDVASWIVAGDYTTRAPATHRIDTGWSYSAQRYDGVNFRNAADGTRNAGAVYAFDTYSVTPAITLTYGGRFAHYDYLEDGTLLSPRASVTLSPADRFRISTLVSRRALAPGAEEFMPRMDTAVWLPPQRTFSSLAGQLQAEYTNHVEVEVERDLAAATISVRAFKQHVTDQLVTVFGVDMPGSPSANLGHYLIGNVGDLDAAGVSAGFRTAVAGRVHGSVEYAISRARWGQPDELGVALLVMPTMTRTEPDRIHDLSTTVETDVPETATRVLVVYRLSNAFARPFTGPEGPAGDQTSNIDTRFDVQVHQSLPFMDFGSAKWEALVAVRNFFRDAAVDSSVYDELLVVRPPKRFVGGITLKF